MKNPSTFKMINDYFPVAYYIYNNFRIKFDRMFEELLGI